MEFLSTVEEHFHVLPLGEESQDLGKILSTDTSLAILKEIYGSDPLVGVSAQSISNALGMGRTTVLYHLNRMVESGVIRLHPALLDSTSWEDFWRLFRSRDAGVSKEQFEDIHRAHIKGVKLYVPAKKGILILPSTDQVESQSLFKEMVASMSRVTAKRKATPISSALGILGVIFIALSFFMSQPNMHNSLQSPPEIRGADQGLQEMTGAEKMMSPADTLVETTAESKPLGSLSASERPFPLQQGLQYVGILSIGSAMGIFLYSRKTG